MMMTYIKSQEIRKLQIGCGSNLLQGWLNTDLNPTRQIAFLDATCRLPFADGTFSYVFCEHMIEHIAYQKAAKLIREIFRVLRPGGKLRIATPDLRFVIDLYGNKSTLNQEYISWMIDRELQGFEFKLDSIVINHLMCGFGHKFIYDFETLKMLLEKNGFTNVTRHKPGESDEMHLKEVEMHGRTVPYEFNNLETMVVECIKLNATQNS